MSETLNLTKEDLARIVEAAVVAARAPNILEQKQIDDSIEREKRRAMLAVELGRAEEQKMQARKNGCTHTRYPQGHKNAGHPAPKGQGEWTTGGQMVGRDVANQICIRCSYGWHWKPTPSELDYIENMGMLGMAPPAPERVIWEG